MSEITTERMLVFLDAITKRPESITDFAWVSYCRAICKRLRSEEMLKGILITAKSIQDGFTEKPKVDIEEMIQMSEAMVRCHYSPTGVHAVLKKYLDKKGIEIAERSI